MKLKYDPFPLIFRQGDEATQLACLEFFGLGDLPRAKTCLVELIKQQHADGTFPSRLDPHNWGMVETVRHAPLLLRVGFPSDGANVNSAVRFILGHQNSDGGWCENRLLQIPSDRGLSNERSVTWLTADAVELLRQVGQGECPECQAALTWLKTMQNRHGGWYSFAGAIGEQQDTPGDPDATAQITFLMGALYGESDPAYTRGRPSFECALDECAQDVQRGYRIRFRDGVREGLDAYGLTFLFLSWLLDQPRRFQRGYDVNDPRVKQIMEALIDIQHEDGGWRPFWSEESSPVYTALAVKVLILSGMLEDQNLKQDARKEAEP